MRDKEILEQILENTTTVKEAVVKEKKERKDTAKARAEAKFKMVGTKLNPQEQERFQAILTAKDTNANAYIKSLIFGEDNTALEDELSRLKAESVEFKNTQSRNEQTIEKLKEEKEKLREEIQELKKEIAEIEDYGFWGLVKLRFFG